MHSTLFHGAPLKPGSGLFLDGWGFYAPALSYLELLKSPQFKALVGYIKDFKMNGDMGPERTIIDISNDIDENMECPDVASSFDEPPPKRHKPEQASM